MKFSSLVNQVVVITGASSGIGKLAVEELVKAGARVVLAARSEESMQQHLQSLLLGEDTAIVVKTDVSDYSQVEHLAQTAIAHFGKIDIWINNAATNLYGYTEDAEIGHIRRIIDVNLLGSIYGIKIVLPIFAAQGYGNIINIGSIDSLVSLPMQSAYDAAKHGLLGFSSALREELLTERYQGMQIDVVDILPASMDTPLNTHAKSTSGEHVKPIPPVYDPLVTVKAIIRYAKRPKPVVIIGESAQLLAANARLMPVITERLLARVAVPSLGRKSFDEEQENDNLYHEMPDSNLIRGGYGTTREGVFTYLQRHKLKLTLKAAMIGLVPLALFTTWAMCRHPRKQPG